jgi:hypothetical protein
MRRVTDIGTDIEQHLNPRQFKVVQRSCYVAAAAAKGSSHHRNYYHMGQ